MVVDGSRDGVVVVDPLASASEGEGVAGAVRPNVVLRYWVEESGGGVGVGAPRELFAEHALRGEIVVLDYAAGRTRSGLPVRRHHVVVRAGDRLVHSFRWYVGAAREVFEVTLTFDEEWLPHRLWEPVAEAVRSARAPLAGEVDVPAVVPGAWDERPETVVVESGPGLDVAESLVEGLEVISVSRERWRSWSEADEVEQAVVRSMAPTLSARGGLRGRRTEVDVYAVLDEAVVVRRRWWGDQGAEIIEREVLRVPGRVAPWAMFVGMDVRAGWMREVSARRPVDAEARSSDAEWEVIAGGERALGLLHGPRDVWAVSTGGGGLVAEWWQLPGEGLLGVFRDADSAQVMVGPVDGWTIYLLVLEAWLA